MKMVSKSRLEARALDCFREVETTGQELVVTDRGKPVLKIVPYRRDSRAARRALKGSVVRYDAPTEPVGLADWEALD